MKSLKCVVIFFNLIKDGNHCVLFLFDTSLELWFEIAFDECTINVAALFIVEIGLRIPIDVFLEKFVIFDIILN